MQPTLADLTDEEFARKETHAQEQLAIDSAETVSRDPLISRGDGFVKCADDPARCANGVRIGPPNYWDERGRPTHQASLIVDPPDGRIPPLTAQAQTAAAARLAARRARLCSSTAAGCHDSWKTRACGTAASLAARLGPSFPILTTREIRSCRRPAMSFCATK